MWANVVRLLFNSLFPKLLLVTAHILEISQTTNQTKFQFTHIYLLLFTQWYTVYTPEEQKTTSLQFYLSLKNHQCVWAAVTDRHMTPYSPRVYNYTPKPWNSRVHSLNSHTFLFTAVHCWCKPWTNIQCFWLQLQMMSSICPSVRPAVSVMQQIPESNFSRISEVGAE